MLDFEYLTGVEGRGANPILVQHTASGADLDAGEGVVVNGVFCINRYPIPEGESGDVSPRGGIYQATVDAAHDPLTVLYKPSGSAVLTDSAEGNLLFGRLLEATTGENQRARVYHDPLTVPPAE